ncbi:hypothetical protein CONPUDRAFT_107199 [Coniophora puteana RWD-64-598 SS2]|uniref:Fungal-type protein kinase domain-containing protein n=1 Tax=Coniophora puteana (strain RWD-64-598) TaxID=741705 RepID=A0A5M3MJ79_CONPW|nr:uncharacterized protein CONPUDRAFT_107199 [Coniophora puteana RWD-64-598 SS2]EIW79096.1 hypothetical protein CONPUDRAFT_107199 [Coniophora puteana RWD-64-598 SS2]
MTATRYLYNDPARHYVYGLTLQGEDLRLWYFSRSHCAKSTPICWTRHPHLFIKVLTSFIFANMKDLGYDPSLWRIDDGQFVYKVGGKFFKTEAILKHHPSLRIPGRATRIWRVIEVEQAGDEEHPRFERLDGVPKVLKDCWINEDAKTEREIQRDIFNRLKGLKEYRLHSEEVQQDVSENPGYLKEDNANLEKLLATAQEISLSGVNFDFREWFENLLGDYTSYFLTIDSPALPFDLATDDGTPETTFKEHRSPPHHGRIQLYDALPNGASDRSFTPKKQCRLVFKEVCHSFSEERDFKHIVQASFDCVGAMVLMYSVGWIHRDISVGNLLIYQRPTTNEVGGILADLEYAKHKEDVSLSKDPKTGTPYFMAAEVATQSFFHQQGYQTSATDIFSDIYSRHDQGLGQARPFRHHAVHDIESMFWVFSGF